MRTISMILFNLFQLFSPAQITIICLLLVLFVLLVVGNILLKLHFHRTEVRKMCNDQLQQRREELLLQLEALKSNEMLSVSEEADDEDNDEEEFENEADDEDETDEVLPVDFSQIPEEEEENSSGENRLKVIAVSDLPESMREKLGVAGEKYDASKYYVRYSYSFEAKLRRASDEVKEYYMAFAKEISAYKGVKLAKKAKQVRIYKGHKTLGLVLFRGKSLCVALALDPKEYAETKYRGKDMSDKKRFAQTPMLLRLNSNRKVEYVKYLIVQLADKNTILLDSNPTPLEMDLSDMDDEALFAADLLKITLLGEVKKTIEETITIDTDLEESNK
ncbi:MAG: hypothetical protein K2N64_01040 [Anaeroplasmataceae bacterium]|nr:hypothetical protein [Anaeroplasmataceae bacterium]